MFGSVIVEIAIGLVFVYLLLSFVVTAVQELVNSVFKIRAVQLAKGIQKMLGANKAKEFFDHALIKGLSPNKLIFRNGTRRPSYIPPRTFVSTLVDMIASAGGQAQRTVAEVQMGINNIRDSDLKKSLTVLLDDCKRDLNEFEKRLETWFNDQMDRVSGWYKRKAQLITLLAALLVTIVMNADTLAIVKTLSSNSTLRALLVKQAEEATKSSSGNQTPQTPQKDVPAKGPKPMEAARQPPAKPDQSPQTKDLKAKDAPKPEEVNQKTKPESDLLFKELSQRFTDVEKSIDRVQGLGLPLGLGWWQNARYTSECPQDKAGCAKKYCPTDKDEDCKELGLFFLAAIPGWILTALAISLGAPFWFDMLNKVVSIRSSGKAPDEKKK